MRKVVTGIFASLLCCSLPLHAFELSGNIAVQQRLFLDDSIDPRQHNDTTSFSTEPELYHRWDDGNQSLTLTPFYRYDRHDDERTHADIRELAWMKVFDGWELTIGISKVFWGVTETQHLVDIINQTDMVENVDGEDKLGQPMLRYSKLLDQGVLDIFILPGFRERSFAGIEGRPRPLLPPATTFDADAAIYESSDGDDHIDFAVRWLMFFDEWELGLSHFSGTGREPEAFVANAAGSLVPYYTLINQTGIDLQALIEEWTWKLELISRENASERFTALTGGFEYTLYGIIDSDTDLGIVIEYLFDDRDENSPSPFQNDIATALRFSLNDAQTSELLVGVITDLDDRTVAGFVEASRRIGSSFRAEIELRSFSNTEPGKPLHDFRQDDFVQAELAWYF